MASENSNFFYKISSIIDKMFETSETRKEAKNKAYKVLSGTDNQEVQENIIKGFKEIVVDAEEAAIEAKKFLESKGFKISRGNMLNNLNGAGVVVNINEKDR